MASAAPGKAQRSAAGTVGGAATIGETGSEEGQGPTPPCTPPDISLYGLVRARAGRSPQSTHSPGGSTCLGSEGAWMPDHKPQKPLSDQTPCLCGPHRKSGRDGGKSTFTEMKDVETEPGESQIPSEGHVKIKYFIP